MRGSAGIYPSLGKYFSTVRELAEAGCMSSRRATDCLSGKKPFKDCEKKAIVRTAILKIFNNELKNVGYSDLEKLQNALTNFDKEFRIGEKQ